MSDKLVKSNEYSDEESAIVPSDTWTKTDDDDALVPTTAEAESNKLSASIPWDTAQQALEIKFTVSFVASATFDATIFGKSVI